MPDTGPATQAVRIEGLNGLPETEEDIRFAEIVRDLVAAGMKAKAARDAIPDGRTTWDARRRADWKRFHNAVGCIGDALADMDIQVLGLNATLDDVARHSMV